VRRFLATQQRYSRIEELGLQVAGIVDLSLKEKKFTRLGLLLVAPAGPFGPEWYSKAGKEARLAALWVGSGGIEGFPRF
jgi:hypothetical protein